MTTGGASTNVESSRAGDLEGAPGTAAYWIEPLTPTGVPGGPVNDIAEAFDPRPGSTEPDREPDGEDGMTLSANPSACRAHRPYRLARRGWASTP